MADDPQVNQEEIEALLKQAQNEAAGTSPTESSGDSEASPPAGETESAADGAKPQAAVAAAIESPVVANAAAQADGLAAGDIDLLLRQAEAAIASVNDPADSVPNVQEFRLKDFAGASPSSDRSTLELIRDVELDLKIELGRTHMSLEDVLKLRKGSVVPLEKLAGDPVDVFVNGRLIARGEVLVLNDNFCVRVTELVASEAVA